MLIKCNVCGHWYRSDDGYESKCQHCKYNNADESSSFMVEWWLKMKLQGILENNS